MTKHIKKIAICVLAGSCVLPAGAQILSEEAGKQANAIKEIEETSEGNVEIEVPANLLELLLAEPEPVKKSGPQQQTLRPGINKLNGFRIQVFSDGRNQTTLESRAKARGSAIVAKFPKYRGQVYTSSSAPNWYTRVGNFRSMAEANNALAELKRAFPKFAGEMRVVKSQIVVIK